eukprot:CAMPEP_0206229004 /NCGR_PEP_ID=MMETSP0047_2-20121206/9464_1 /ASSEMBLY_ACC=CAM_ASM_000192 /TAXON_ID=195065 /ORGANISM="Chroomonas mesostigmatica_cf, Strain CCMP1168" /LENGTH=74 /DNA_ID=CAMNT_0053652271 /DNA_START=266 /DNA_END=490 /DNA_ORIENTATION=-
MACPCCGHSKSLLGRARSLASLENGAVKATSHALGHGPATVAVLLCSCSVYFPVCGGCLDWAEGLAILVVFELP